MVEDHMRHGEATSTSGLLLQSVPQCGLCGSGDAVRLFAVHEFGFVRCTRCTLVRLSPRLAPSALGELYGGEYYPATPDPSAIEQELRNPTFAYRRRILEQHTASRSIMEIGCGDGNFLAFLHRHGWAVTGSEFSQGTVETALRKHGISVYQGEFSSLGFPDAHFNVIGMYHVLEHVYEPMPFIREIGRTMKPRGIVHIQIPFVEGLEGRLAGRYSWALGVPQHTYLYGLESLSMLLAVAGLRIVSKRNYDPFHSPASTANTIRSVAAAILKGTEPRLVLPAGLAIDQPHSPDSDPKRRYGHTRAILERGLDRLAQVLSRAEAMVNRGNILDVVARKD